MQPHVIILLVAIAVYWYYCIFWNLKATPAAQTASDYFIANRSIPHLWFILAATATSFSGWTFISHPGMIFSNGFQAALISFYAITVAFTGVLFMKRQWLLGKRFNFITPGDMFADYFKSAGTAKLPQIDGIRLGIVIVALLYSVLYIAVQLRVSGYLVSILTGWEQSEIAIMWALALVLLLYVAVRGLRRVAYVDRMQLFLKAAGIVTIGILVFYQVGGWNGLKVGIIHLMNFDYHRAPYTADYSHYAAIPGVIRTDVWNFLKDTQTDGWTGMMLLSFVIATMGIQASPAFTMWAFSNKTPQAFAPQQVIASSLVIGFILLVFTSIQGLGANLLGANPEFAQTHPEVIKNYVDWPGKVTDRLIPNVILSLTKMIDNPPLNIQVMVGFLIALLAIAALAAMQSTASSYISTCSGILTRDLFNQRHSRRDQQQISLGRLMAVFVVLAALIMASIFKGSAVALLGGLAVAYGLQMWPALVAICWWPFLTRTGIIWGLVTGLIVVTLTENPGDIFSTLFGLGPNGWMRWPLTIHPAGWGIVANFVVAFLVSGFTQNKEEIKHRLSYHQFLRNYAELPPAKKEWKPVAWVFTLIWFAFAVGPGAVIGNDFFGNPNDPNTWWFFGMIPIWAWQAVWWGIGVVMMWFLAYYLEMSTMSDQDIDRLEQDLKLQRS
jgi:Na+/proline symporter